MSMIETAQDGPRPSDPEAARPSSAEVTGWLLEGRWFTVDLAGKITAWSPAATDRFGWQRADVAGKPFAETLIAPAGRADASAAIEAALEGAAAGQAGYIGGMDALDAAGRGLRAAFALVPIQLSVGYEFNELLQELSSAVGNPGSVAQLKSRHESVLDLIDSALSGRAAESAQTADGGRLAGALVVFSAGAENAAPAAAAAPPPDNVVSIADADARSQLERARADLEAAKHELQRTQNDADVARQETSDARDALAVSQRQAEAAQRQVEDARRAADEARAAAEDARIRFDEAERDAGRLRSELRDARTAMRASVEEADAELIHARAEMEWAQSEAAEHKAEAGRAVAEVEALRERLQETQRELGVASAEIEAARAEHAQGAAVSERRGSEAERLRGELDEARAELERLAAELSEPRTIEFSAVKAGDADPRLRAAFDHAPVATALMSPGGRIVDVNAAFCEALGHDRELLLSDDVPAVVHPDDVDAKRALAARMLAGEQAEARVYRRYLHASGHAITMHEAVALVRDAEGRPELFVLQLEHADADRSEELVVDAELAAEELDGPSEQAIRRALEEELFELHAQPVLDLRTNETPQYELLIRMVGEDGRLLLPQAFLGPARRAGLGHALDRWVACQAIRMLEHIPGDVRLEVNLSPEAIHDDELAAVIEQELASTPIDPGRLILEVTGQTALEDMEATRTLSKRIRGLGCRFALDDFRSTFGSFRLLKDLSLDYLKLDGELVGSLSESRTSQLIVKALVDVAAGTGMKTVAVFVSDEQTLGLLRQQGVDFAQGYAVGRPRPVAEAWPGDAPAQLAAGE
jgi:PAS domain S-box-containing protein